MIIIALLLLGSLLPNLSFTASVKVRIVNGNEAKPHSRPYMVSVVKNGRHICAGFLISDQFVLTAAHCRDGGEALTVMAGAHDLVSKKEKHITVSVQSYHKHPDYNPKSSTPNKGDLMILELRNKVQLNDNIKTIPIPTTPEEIKENTACSVAGWGFVTNSGPASLTLREANVKVKNNTDCAARRAKVYVASQMMCVYGKGGTCQGDSGGPLVCGNTAVGITSFGRKDSCNDPVAPNVSIKISAFLQWIKSITKI